MSEFFMSVVSGVRDHCEPGYHTSAFGALWIGRGTGMVNGQVVNRGEGTFLERGDRIEIGPGPKSRWLRFDLSRERPKPDSHSSIMLTEQFEVAPGDVLLRLDQVKFPPGATAYRHVHPGGGIRFLTAGKLTLIGDNHEAIAQPGHAWFEHENSPVRAIASYAHPMTSFVRFMVLPAEYAGKPTIQVLNPNEAALPRLQITQRHFDQIVQVEPG